MKTSLNLSEVADIFATETARYDADCVANLGKRWEDRKREAELKKKYSL